MPKYVVKRSNDGICHCRCDFAIATHRGQLDDPWCGCGWLFSCVVCRKAFTFGEVVYLPTSYDSVAHTDFANYMGVRPTRDDVVAWREVMRDLMSPLRVGQTVVYFDGYFLPLRGSKQAFEGLFARHRFKQLPHQIAKSQPHKLFRVLGDPTYWLERRLPDLIVLAGPNGAGKTTFANEYLRDYGRELKFVNADEIARRLEAGVTGAQVDLRAGRAMLGELDALAKAKTPFMFETTLASLSYLPKIRQWREAGYRVRLVYLRLPNVQTSLERVRRRVEAGGHSIPDEIVQRRFTKSLEYLEQRYKVEVDEWYVWDSLEGDVRLAASWDD